MPVPGSLGVPDTAFGALLPGRYRYHLTHVRLADRLEGPAISSEPIEVTQGGLRLDGLPERDGYAINVYLSGQDGEGAYLAGVHLGGAFEFGGSNASLVLPCRTLGARTFPVGTFTGFWRGLGQVGGGVRGVVVFGHARSPPVVSSWAMRRAWAGVIGGAASAWRRAHSRMCGGKCWARSATALTACQGGHESGAFTGAQGRQVGREPADGSFCSRDSEQAASFDQLGVICAS